jgi:hypothetical protein
VEGGGGGFETSRISMATQRKEVSKKETQFNDYFKVFILFF